MSRVIGYAYEADIHCVGCTQERFGTDFDSENADEHGLRPDFRDNEHNPIGAVFDTDEHPPEGEYCGDCHGCIYEPYKEETDAKD